MPGGGSTIAEPKAHEIEQALRARVDDLVPELIKGAIRDGAFWSCASIDGGAGTQMKINRTGPRRGLWTDFSDAKGSDRYSGDLLKLICVIHFGGWSRGDEARGKAIAWARSWLGWDDLAPGRLEKVRREAATRDEAAERAAAIEAEGKRKSAVAIWSGSLPIRGTPAESYLRGRGIDFERLGRIPGSLRYLPDCWCSIRRSKHPAMIACIMALDGSFLAAHRTYLDVSAGKGGPVTVVKVAVAEGKMRIATAEDRKAASLGGVKIKSHKLSLGTYGGGCIPLWKGACIKTLREIDAGTSVYVSEGIEDGLSVAMADPNLRVVAGVALANMGGLLLPPQAGPIVFIGQNDAIDGKAIEAFEGAIARQQEAARESGRPKPQLFFPKPQFKDFNDQLLGKAMV